MTLRATWFVIQGDYGLAILILTHHTAKKISLDRSEKGDPLNSSRVKIELEPRKDVVAFAGWGGKPVVSKGVRTMIYFVNIKPTNYYLSESQYSIIDDFNSALFISTLETNYDFIW